MVCFLRHPVTICVWRRSALKLLLGPNNLFKSRSDHTGTMWSHKKHWWKLVYGKIVQINVTWQQVSLPGNHGFSIFFLIAPVASFANEIYSGLRFLPARNCSKLGKDSDDCSPLSSRKRSVFFLPQLEVSALLLSIKRLVITITPATPTATATVPQPIATTMSIMSEERLVRLVLPV